MITFETYILIGLFVSIISWILGRKHFDKKVAESPYSMNINELLFIVTIIRILVWPYVVAAILVRAFNKLKND